MAHTVSIKATPAVTLGKIGHGLMGMTWRPEPIADEETFASLKYSLENAPAGAKVLINSGEFYGNPDDPNSNLKLLNRFFTKYPALADKAFLSVKGAAAVGKPGVDCSAANIARSVDHCNNLLGGVKTIDLFEAARVDKDIPLEEQIGALAEAQKAGKFAHIGLSEASAATLIKAHSITPIAAIEIEVSPFSWEEETKKVIAAAEERGIAVVAYSPIGRGLLTGAIKSVDDLPEKDHRRHFTRFKDENLKHNLAIVDEIKSVASKKGVSVGQLSIAWVGAQGAHIIPIPGSSKADRTKENLGALDVKLTSEELNEINSVINSNTVKGGRYIDGMETQFKLWN